MAITYAEWLKRGREENVLLAKSMIRRLRTEKSYAYELLTDELSEIVVYKMVDGALEMAIDALERYIKRTDRSQLERLSTETENHFRERIEASKKMNL